MYGIKGAVSVRHLLTMNASSKMTWRRCKDGGEVLRKQPICPDGVSLTAKYPVGIEPRVREIDKLLGVGGNDVRMVGIWGTGGIGKTTIAKAVYNSIAHMFEGSCFLDDVRERSMPYGGLVKLESILLSEILGVKEVKLTNVDKGINVIKKMLNGKKLLLVLDDVNQLDQLNKLVGGSDWFGSGSRIVLTTRDKHLLIAHKVNLIYEVEKLDHYESLKLFTSWNSFSRNGHLEDDYAKLANNVVDYADGLPLALMVLGSHLCGRSIDQWKYALDGYRRVPNRAIQEILKISYNALEDAVKEVFLDIAFFCKGLCEDYVIQILEGCDLNPKYDLEVLVEKALINITEDGRIWMHDLIQEMGKEVVRQESPTEPGKRSRLWFHEDVYHVLTENTGTDKIKGIMVKLPAGLESDEVCLNAESFSKMKNLRLFINHNARLSGEVHYLPNELRLLSWPEYPSQSLPANFNPKKLVGLTLPRSRILRLDSEFKSLTFINVEHSKFLRKSPDFSGVPNLELLNLNYCTSLDELHPSAGFLHKLVKLSLTGCRSLTLFPRIVNLKSLLELNLEGCISLENFPEIKGKMESLKYLDLSETSIKELPSSSIRHFTRLEKLDLTGCENLTNLPCSIYELKHLVKISVRKCSKLVSFPKMAKSEDSRSAESLVTLHGGNLAFPKLSKFYVGGSNLSDIADFLLTLHCMTTLTRLDLSGSNFVSLPVCINNFVNLIALRLVSCKRLREIPDLPQALEILDVSDCLSLERVSKLSNILERKESQMFTEMKLTNCWRLRNNLVRIAKKKNMFINQVNLFSLFLLSLPLGVEVEFPGRGIPKWFSYRKDLKDLCECQFSIKIPQNFNWENKGISICAFLEKTKNRLLSDAKSSIREFAIDIYVNEVCPDNIHSTGKDSSSVWLLYIPFHTLMWMRAPFWEIERMKRNVKRTWVMPPYLPTIRVHFVRISKAVKSCGVHLVMPPG
ncbi:TMV resistance protein N-like isoform X2 [Prunus avium]|uniref:TMV resistance protein N-like isoform X2 n=1 Tax=Prunus avium TaxID=42229 RepID=A0A6P5U5E0_PRUAV|nr:TMV resistance protein N-like isoform X2 [Prunus avium]